MMITTTTITNSYCADIHVNLTFSDAYYNILSKHYCTHAQTWHTSTTINNTQGVSYFILKQKLKEKINTWVKCFLSR